MLASSRYSIPKAAVYAVSVVVQAACALNAQNFTARSASFNPFGINGPLPFGEMADDGGGLELKGGLTYGVGLSSTYSSNILLSENDPESDFSLSVLPNLSYSTDPEGGAMVAISANYTPSARASLSNSDYNSFDQTGSVSMIVSGSRTTISAFAGISQDSGADSLAADQGFFTGTAVSFGLQGSYQLAPRTSISAGWASSITSYGNGAAGGSSAYSLSISGSWAATERLSFGPSISYSPSSSDTTGDIDTWGFAGQGSYKASEKIQLSASIGVQHSVYSREKASGDFSPTGSLNASYQINELWSWGGSIQSGLTPSPTGKNYVINGWQLSSHLSRQLLIGSAGIGVTMDFSNFESVGPAGQSQASQESQENAGFSLNYSRPLFSDRVGFTSSLVYTLNSGDIRWSQLSLNASLSMAF